MNEEEIDDMVATIMHNDGPDGHTDGSEVIAAFIMALLRGEGEIWFEKYMDIPDADASFSYWDRRKVMLNVLGISNEGFRDD